MAVVKNAPAPNRAKRQHWVPQFYLRYFATPSTRDSDEPQVWIFSKNDADGDERLTNIRNVCNKRYLYSPTMPSGARDWTLEEKLGDVEAFLGDLWPALAHDFIALEDEHVRKGLALFVATMHLRNPAMRNQVERIHRRIVDLFEDGPLRSDGIPDVRSVNVQGRSYAFDPSDWHSYRSWNSEHHDRFFTGAVRMEAGYIATILLQKRWSIVLADFDAFVTSDKPVGVKHRSLRSCGVATEGAIVTFPLSPTRMLVMDDMHREPPHQYYPLKAVNVGAFNGLVWNNASRFLITGRSISEVLTEMSSPADGPQQ